ncbi:polymerase III polypeptide H [Dacryopinax primogenitus]|uniref:Polymerase III polypeptide H n=1 Tax=Dacryopinax primogenitus (strain DJM 731) TaxID=1858805 RepID=M5G017_DACPD|nr:polymerase III polypeptide H [Dacryopinax primogenitus]EJU03606.1 polymerase III polypeptide H [Dacryopinax primogenitus]
MFVLARLKDTLPIHPSQFSLPGHEALTYEINRKYSDRVLHDVGLCIVLFDILECSEGRVRFGDGCLWHKVTFRMVVFRPFVGEVLVGEVKGCAEEGVQVSLGFFDDIHVPTRLLPPHTTWDPEDQVFFWAPQLSDGQDPLDIPKEERFTVDVGAKIRVCVDGDEFVEEEPSKGPIKRKAAAPGAVGVAGIPGTFGEEEEALRRAPYSITCAASTSGLGLVDWWVQTVAEEEGMEEEQE